jgi:hypothetical protein
VTRDRATALVYHNVVPILLCSRLSGTWCVLIMSQRRLARKISGALEELDALSADRPWIPSSAQIRPSTETTAKKKTMMAEVGNKWISTLDYIAHTVFGAACQIRPSSGACFVRPEDKSVLSGSSPVFLPNSFPYATQEGNHWVLWFPTATQTVSDDEITTVIGCFIESLLVPTDDGKTEAPRFEFVWYINPKMSVPEYFHVQVFWTSLL